MADENGGAGGADGSGADDGAWKAAFGAEAAPSLESYKTPADFLKAFTDTTNEAKTLKEKAPVFGDSWRQALAGEDAKALSQLERFQNPKALWDSYQQAAKRISSGELKAPLPENATPEQVTAWRKENGVPEKAEDYLANLPDGLVIGETDKPIFDSFVKGLHELNADPKLAHYAVKWYQNFQEEQAASVAEADTAHKSEVEDVLRAEWGADYRANVSHLKGFLSGLPKGVGEKIANARGEDGRALLNDPDVLKALAQTARDINPVHTLVPGTDGNQPKAVDDEIAKIEKVMRTNRAEYNRDEKMQKRLRDLYTARDKLKGRAA